MNRRDSCSSYAVAAPGSRLLLKIYEMTLRLQGGGYIHVHDQNARAFGERWNPPIGWSTISNLQTHSIVNWGTRVGSHVHISVVKFKLSKEVLSGYGGLSDGICRLALIRNFTSTEIPIPRTRFTLIYGQPAATDVAKRAEKHRIECMLKVYHCALRCRIV